MSQATKVRLWPYVMTAVLLLAAFAFGPRVVRYVGGERSLDVVVRWLPGVTVRITQTIDGTPRGSFENRSGNHTITYVNWKGQADVRVESRVNVAIRCQLIERVISEAPNELDEDSAVGTCRVSWPK